MSKSLVVLFGAACTLFFAAQLSVKAEAPAKKKPIRKAFVMTVNAGQEAEYARRHQPIWPELEATLKKHGVVTYSIFLLPETRQLFGYVEFEDQAQWDAVAKTEVCQRWWKHMRDVMPSNPDNSPVSQELKEVFHIEQ